MLRSSDIAEFVSAQLELIDDMQLAAAIKPLLTTPRCEDRGWDYGAVGEKYPCWIVLEHAASNTAIAYCSQGFGPKYPWGLISLSGPHDSIGMDCSWYPTIEEAFRESAACDVPPSPGY